jgi:hypothetical protein
MPNVQEDFVAVPAKSVSMESQTEKNVARSQAQFQQNTRVAPQLGLHSSPFSARSDNRSPRNCVSWGLAPPPRFLLAAKFKE